MKRRSTVVWILLMALTIVSFALGEQNASVYLILGAAGLKASLVAWHFMDLRKAAFVWSVAVVGIIGMILGTAILFLEWSA